MNAPPALLHRKPTRGAVRPRTPVARGGGMWSGGGRKGAGSGRRGNSLAGSGGGGRCVGGPATAGRLPMGCGAACRGEVAKVRGVGIGVRCCSVSSRRRAVSGSFSKALRRPFRCGRVPFRRTRLLVALERRGSGRLSDGEGLHELLGGRGEDLQDVV